MAFDEQLAARIRGALKDQPDITEQRMFGGIGYMDRGNMMCGIHNDQLIARIGADAAKAALDQPHVVPFDVGGRPWPAAVMVNPEGIADAPSLQHWLDAARAFTQTLPAK